MKSLNHLVVLEAVARLGSVTAAAAELGISQPAASRSMQALRRSLGVAMFERTASGIRLTPAGAVAAEHAGRVVRVVAELERAVADLSSFRAGELRVGATPNIGTYLLPEVIVRFRRKYPGVRFHLEIGPTARLAGAVAGRELDMALCESEPDCEGVAGEVFARDEMVPVASAVNPLARDKQVSPARFCRETMILHSGHGGRASFVELALAAKKLTVRPGLTLDSTEAIKRAVAADLGVAIVPRLSVRSELTTGTLVEIALNGLAISRPLYLATRAREGTSKPRIAFMCLVKHAVRGSLPPLGRA